MVLNCFTTSAHFMLNLSFTSQKWMQCINSTRNKVKPGFLFARLSAFVGKASDAKNQHDLLQKRCKHTHGNHWHWLFSLSPCVCVFVSVFLSFKYSNADNNANFIHRTECHHLYLVNVAWQAVAKKQFFRAFLYALEWWARERGWNKGNTQINPIPSSLGRCLTNRIFVWIHLAFIWTSICMYACLHACCNGRLPFP